MEGKERCKLPSRSIRFSQAKAVPSKKGPQSLSLNWFHYVEAARKGEKGGKIRQILKRKVGGHLLGNSDLPHRGATY